VASRRTVVTDEWQMLDGVTLAGENPSWSVEAAYLSRSVRFPDRIAVTGQGRFRVLGRMEDQVNIAGHRASLGDLTQKLLEVDGVQDGVFFLPDHGQAPLMRLTAVVVAPGKTREDIQRALRWSIDPVFLPRPLLLVPKLPRNETGKLPREALRRLIEQHSEQESPHEL
jgi:acyl-coenzyme A synthetase/AMP-(fatty) acid ligase